MIHYIDSIRLSRERTTDVRRWGICPLHQPSLGKNRPKKPSLRPLNLHPGEDFTKILRKNLHLPNFPKILEKIGKTFTLTPKPSLRWRFRGPGEGSGGAGSVEFQQNLHLRTETFTLVHFLPGSEIKTWNVRFLHISPPPSSLKSASTF